MQKGPKIKLSVDLQKIDRYFPLDHNPQGGFDYDMVIDRGVYDEMAALLDDYDISEDQVIQELCFIMLWVEKETRAGSNGADEQGKFYLMWDELDNLKDYLLKNRVTSVTFKGEYERNKAGEELTLNEEINIDRLCDGIRSVFREEFSHDKQRRRTKGLTAWQSRKMSGIKNNFLNYFTTVPILDEISLEEQNELIVRISELAGLPE
jgi:hypothetical protein